MNWLSASLVRELGVIGSGPFPKGGHFRDYQASLPGAHHGLQIKRHPLRAASVGMIAALAVNCPPLMERRPLVTPKDLAMQESGPTPLRESALFSRLAERPTTRWASTFRTKAEERVDVALQPDHLFREGAITRKGGMVTSRKPRKVVEHLPKSPGAPKGQFSELQNLFTK